MSSSESCPICTIIGIEFKLCRKCERVVCVKCSVRKVCFDNATEPRRVCNECVTQVEADLIPQLKSRLSDDLAAIVSDDQCIRFLRARNLDLEKSSAMLTAWWKWWNSPLPGTTDTLPKNVLPDSVEDPKEDVYTRICPHALIGEDREGRPAYWEKTGIISANFSDLKKCVRDEDELIVRHVRMNEINEARLVHQSSKHNKQVSKNIVIFDMNGLNMSPDFMGIRYFRKMLEIDQNYYPERLHRLYLINAPWFFTAIYALVSPWIDPVTAQKIQIIGSDFLPALRESFDDENIPVDLGGKLSNIVWHWPYPEESGISPQQLADYVNTKKESSESSK